MIGVDRTAALAALQRVASKRAGPPVPHHKFGGDWYPIGADKGSGQPSLKRLQHLHHLGDHPPKLVEWGPIELGASLAALLLGFRTARRAELDPVLFTGP